MGNASTDAEERSFLRFAGPSGGSGSSRLPVGVVGSLAARTSISRGVFLRASVGDSRPSSSSVCRVRFLPLPTEGEGGIEDGVMTISGFPLEEARESWEDSEEDVPVGSEGDFALVRESGVKTRPNASVCMDTESWRCLAIISPGTREAGRQGDDWDRSGQRGTGGTARDPAGSGPRP